MKQMTIDIPANMADYLIQKSIEEQIPVGEVIEGILQRNEDFTEVAEAIQLP